MKNNNPVPAACKLNLLRQICNFIPEFLVPKLARATGVQDKARTFSPWSHLVALMYAQLTHSIGLNDVCDALGLHAGPLSSLRDATPPNRNTLSHANKVRPAAMAERLFWAVLEHLGHLSPDFVSGRVALSSTLRTFILSFLRPERIVTENLTGFSPTAPAFGCALSVVKHRQSFCFYL